MSGFRIDSGHVLETSELLFLKGYVAIVMGSCSLISFSIDLGSMMNCSENEIIDHFIV